MAAQQHHATRVPGCPARNGPAEQEEGLGSRTAGDLVLCPAVGLHRDSLPLDAKEPNHGTSPTCLPGHGEVYFCALGDVMFPFSQFLRQSAEQQSSSEGKESQEGERGSIAIKRDEMKNKGDGPM